MFESLYETSEKIKSLGGLYRPPNNFPHGEWKLVAEVKKNNDDGADAEVHEMRLPARCFKVEVKDGNNSTGKPIKTFTLSTGSGGEMGELCGLIAKAASEGMIAIE